jgi:hypothetical protein
MEPLYTWLIKHGLKRNLNKSQASIFSQTVVQYKNVANIIINGATVRYCAKVKNLGFILTLNCVGPQKFQRCVREFILHCTGFINFVQSLLWTPEFV